MSFLSSLKGNNFKQFIKSFVTVTTISSLVGFAGTAYDKPFWSIFSYCTAAQFVLGYTVAALAQNYYKNNTYIAELNALEKLSTLLNCAYCNQPNVVTFLPDEIPNMVCDKCKNTNSIKLQFSVSRTTIPMNAAPAESILKEPQRSHKIKL